MKITLDLTAGQADALLAFCERLSSTPVSALIPDLQLLQEASHAVAEAINGAAQPGAQS
jgi:hypothetical protein